MNISSAPTCVKSSACIIPFQLHNQLKTLYYYFPISQIKELRFRGLKGHAEDTQQFGKAGPFCLPIAQAPAASLSPALTLQSCLEMTGDCVAGPGWGWEEVKLGLSEGAYPRGACLVGDLGGSHAVSFWLPGIDNTGVRCGKAANGQGRPLRGCIVQTEPLNPEALVHSVPCPLWSSIFSLTHMLWCDNPGRQSRVSLHASSRVSGSVYQLPVPPYVSTQ